MDASIAATLAQFGAAGLIGWMWLSERRGAQEREQMLRDAHERLGQSQAGLGALLKALDDNTRAIATLEGTQRRLCDALARRAGRTQRPGPAERRAGEREPPQTQR